MNPVLNLSRGFDRVALNVQNRGRLPDCRMIGLVEWLALQVTRRIAVAFVSLIRNFHLDHDPNRAQVEWSQIGKIESDLLIAEFILLYTTRSGNFDPIATVLSERPVFTKIDG